MSDATQTPASPRPRTERRTVEVTDPALSPRTREILTQEARDAVGADSVEVPVDRPSPASDSHLSTPGQAPSLNLVARLTVAFGVVCIVAGIIGLITNSGDWGFVCLAFGFVVVPALLIISGVLGMTRLSGHPSAAATAAMTADGVPNPEEFFSAIVDEFTPLPSSGAGEHRTVSAHDDAATANREQKDAMTPGSQPSRAVGPS